MNAVKTRKNKTYTTIFLNKCTPEAFKEAIDIYNNLEGKAIIKPTQKAYDDYLEAEKPFEKIKDRQILEFEILGVPFKKQYERSVIFNEQPLIIYKNHEGSEVKMYGVFNYTTLLEEVFQRHTGKLLFF